ncbi:MAG: efflux RND transporter periplasmic adaptor subunit, partial [Bryobacteraceae bacterium]
MKPVVTVKTVKVEQADIPLSVDAPATLFPRTQANIAARITAPIRELRARKGDSVPAGQVLALLENRDLLAQRREAAGSVADAQATLQKAAGGTVPSEVERGRGQLETAQASLNQAQKIYDKRQELFKQGAIPERELLVTQTELANAKTNVEVARKSLDLFKNQSAERDIKIAESRVEQAQARKSLIDTQLQYAEIRAPFAGTITDQFQYAGDMASPATPIFTLMDVAVLIARAQVPESSVGQIKLGQKCSFSAAGETAVGRVSVINQAVDPARRTVETWCEIPKPPPSLRAGLFGQVSVASGSVQKAAVVPAAAVQFDEGTHNGFVLVVDRKNIAHKKEVEGGAVF